MSIFVKEIFYSLQGEGIVAGRGALFIRTGQCNLNCHFCDTNWRDGLITMDDDEIAAAAVATLLETVGEEKLKEYPATIIFTGGEPSLWDMAGVLEEFAKTFITRGWKPFIYHIESNGTMWWPWMRDCNLTISPKTPIRHLSVLALEHASALKFLYGKNYPRHFEDVELSIHTNRFSGAVFYLQPIWNDDYEENLKGAVDYCIHNPKFRLSMQLHKYLNLR